MIDEKKLKPFRPIGKRPLDWIEYAIRFFFGVCFGALAGLIFNFQSASYGTIELIVTSALIFGLIALVLGDHFWRFIGFIVKINFRRSWWE